MGGRLLCGEDIFISETPFMQDVFESCKKWKDRVFLVDGRTKEEVTYHEFLQKIGSFSSAIRRLGQNGKIVTLFSDFCPDAAVAIYGIYASGATAAGLNPLLPKDEMASLIRMCESEVIFCGPNYRQKVEEAAKAVDWTTTIICPGGGGGTIDFLSCLQEDNESGLDLEGWWTGPDHRLVINFTSGTTGVPKGAEIRDQSIKFNYVAWDYWDEKTRFMLSTPIYWNTNTLLLADALVRGCEVIIAGRMTPQELARTVKEHRPTDWLCAPPILLEICKLDIGPEDFSSMKYLWVAGSVLLPEHRKQINEKLMGGRSVVRCAYGSTEAGIMIHDSKEEKPESKWASMGRTAKGVFLKIVDVETGALQPPMAVGELCVKSPGVLKKYLNRALTEEELDKEGFWHLGDLGYYDEDGYVYYSARIKEIMKYKGQQIAPAELEGVLLRHPDILEACVVGKTSIEEGGELPAAFVVKKPGSMVTEEELFSFVADKVIDEKKLRGGIYFVDSFPKSAIGKVLRQELQKRLV